MTDQEFVEQVSRALSQREALGEKLLKQNLRRRFIPFSFNPAFIPLVRNHPILEKTNLHLDQHYDGHYDPKIKGESRLKHWFTIKKGENVSRQVRYNATLATQPTGEVFHDMRYEETSRFKGSVVKVISSINYIESGVSVKLVDRQFQSERSGTPVDWPTILCVFTREEEGSCLCLECVLRRAGQS